MNKIDSGFEVRAAVADFRFRKSWWHDEPARFWLISIDHLNGLTLTQVVSGYDLIKVSGDTFQRKVERRN